MQSIITNGYILLVWSILFVVFTGIGLLAQYLFKRRTGTIDTFFNAFWIGFALTIAGLQLWHLLLPVQAGAFLVCTGAAAIGLIVQRFFILQGFNRLRENFTRYGW